ncbi:hypothetical protein D9M68_809420 [compost metagenome]
MGMVADLLEVLSDALGFLGGLALIIPSYRIMTESRALYEVKQEIAKRLSGPAHSDALDFLNDKLGGAEKVVLAYNPKDFSWIYRGVLLILLAFVIKLVFHAITKL